MTEENISEALNTGLSESWQRIHRSRLTQITKLYKAWLKENDRALSADTGLLTFIPLLIESTEQKLQSLHRSSADFSGRYARAATELERNQHILNFARDLGSSSRDLKRDEASFQLWFGADAVSERYQRRVAEQERMLALCIDRFAGLASRVIQNDPQSFADTWRRFKIRSVLLRQLKYQGEQRVRLTAYEALEQLTNCLPVVDRESTLGRPILQTTLQTALDSRTSPWLQSAALSVLSRVSVEWLCRAVRRRFEYTDLPDAMFVRARAVGILQRVIHQSAEARLLIHEAAVDPSAHVRQAVAFALPELPSDQVMALLPVLATEDSEPSVRAAAVLAIGKLVTNPELFPVCLTTIALALKKDRSNFVVRVALRETATSHLALINSNQRDTLSSWELALNGPLNALHESHDALTVRRWSRETLETLWAQRSTQRYETLTELREQVAALRSGETLYLEVDPELTEDVLARLLAVQAQRDCGFDLTLKNGRARILKHDRFGFRIWRFLHETRHPSSDKRQAFQHTIGRHYPSRVQAQSQIMAELSETKVPGEPLFNNEEGGWRPYLPLVDQVISACGLSSRPMRLYSSEGVTTINPPHSLLKRLNTRIKLSRDVSHLSQLRNWHSRRSESPRGYVAALRKYGIGIEFSSHHTKGSLRYSEDPSVKRFFGTSVVVIPPQILESFAEYFVSIYQNSLRELVAFLIAIGALFFGRHMFVNFQMRAYRRSVPLVIGGWGTRGKSGTERLKAALFNSLGLNIVSKTTGCEAMFVHGHAYGSTRELFLFRPYDKATIWEQVGVMRIARDLGCEVFLWECMGLTPSYVHTLQRQWMQDDLATICNTYPDHEDLQGPAGINIPQVMQNFVPENSTLISTEEQMTPLLEQEATQVGTEFIQAGWLEAGLITPDLLERFPYEEHPLNMALVCATAAQVGVPRDYALKEMADNVIPDLGVLKSYPLAQRQTRCLEFVMGMSANERLGCMGNWQRMGFADHDPVKSPGVWTSTVVNNRADRIARSRVFASILVKDVSADRHVLIGTNLDGLQSYMKEAWQEIADTKTLWPEAEEADTPLQILTAEAHARRIPTSIEMVRLRLLAMLEGIGAQEIADDIEHWLESPPDLSKAVAATHSQSVGDDVARFLSQYLEELASFEALATEVQHAQPSETLDHKFRDQLWSWFYSHVIVIENEHATGDNIIQEIYDNTPPGYQNRIMGMQNIKGTGLDYVYAWQAWESCARACAMLMTACWDDASSELQARLDKYKPSPYRKGDLGPAEQGLRTLASFQEYNLLCEETVREVCSLVRESAAAQTELFQAELNVIEQALSEQLQSTVSNTESANISGILSTSLAFIESLLDAGDAISRRQRANLIYRELGRERISVAKAALELQKLTKRQKGGWFVIGAQQRLQQALPEMLRWLRSARKLGRRKPTEQITST